jgi:hypothetical protein
MHIIKTSFNQFLIPENTGTDTQLIIMQLLYEEIWPIVGSRMIFLGFVATKNNVLKAKEMAK